MPLTLRYSIVNIQIFKLRGIRAHMIKIFHHVNRDLEPRILKVKLAQDIIIPTNVKIY